MKRSSVTSNYIYNLTYQLILTLIPLFTTPYLTRILGAKNLGIYSYTYSIVTIFFLLAALGINTYGQREIAYVQDNKEKRSKIFWELMIIRTISTLISISTLILLSLTVTKYNIYYQIFSIYTLANLFDITWLYQGIENFKSITTRNIIIKLLYLISIFIFIKDKTDLSTYILLFSSMTLITNLSFWIKIKNIIISPKNLQLELKKHLKPTLTFFIPQIASLLYTVLDKTMLGIINPDIKQVSYYEQASYIVKTSLMLITTISTVMVSKVSYAYKNNKTEQINNYLNETTNFVWLAGSAVTFGICAIIKNFVPWFYSKEYLNVTPLVYIMSPIIILIGLNNILGVQFLIPTKKQNKYILAIVIGSITNLILNLILIKPLGTIGATIASLIAELIILIIELHFLKKIIPNFNILKNSFKYILFGIIMFIITYYIGTYLKPTISTTIIQTLIGIIIYTTLLLLTKDKFIFKHLNKIKKKRTN